MKSIEKVHVALVTKMRTLISKGIRDKVLDNDIKQQNVVQDEDHHEL